MTRYLVTYTSVQHNVGEQLIEQWAESAQEASEYVAVQRYVMAVTSVFMPAALWEGGQP